MAPWDKTWQGPLDSEEQCQVWDVVVVKLNFTGLKTNGEGKNFFL